MKDKKINILLATGIYPPDIGGPATYVKTLKNELPDLGLDVRVVTYGNNVKAEDEEVFVVSRGQNIFFRYFKYFLTIYRLRNWFDEIYIQGPVSEGLPAVVFCKLFRRKYFLKIVGDYAWEQGCQRFGVMDLLDDFQDRKYNFKVEIIRKIQRWTVRGAGLVITPSKYLKKIVEKWGVDGDKIKVIYNSVKDVELELSKEDAKKELNLEGDIIMTSGRLVPWKGFSLLINLMPELLKINPSFKLAIVGNGPDKNKLESQIQELGLEKSVFLITGKKKEDVLRYMRASDMFVLNTGYEGLSHMLIEAIQIGVPIITTRVGGNPEVIKDKSTGLLVEYENKSEIKDSILDIWKNKDIGKKFVNNARLDLYKFSEKKMIEGVMEIFK